MNIPLPEPISSKAHYDDIPTYCLGNTILDVGSSNGYGAVMSRHVTHFLSNEYLGVDIQSFEDIYLPIIKTDIFDFKTECRFDTILVLHILEHIDINRWPAFFKILKSLLDVGGHIVINVPFRELKKSSSTGAMEHKVLGITEELLLSPHLTFKFTRMGKTARRIIFRESGEGILRPSLRFIWRIIRHHEYSMFRTLRSRPARIMAIHKKEGLRNHE